MIEKPTTRQYTSTEEVFLKRLKRLVRLRGRTQKARYGLPKTKLLDWAIYSTLSDCMGLGVGEEARRIIDVGKQHGG